MLRPAPFVTSLNSTTQGPRRSLKWWSAAFSALAISACGGSTGGTSPTTTVVIPPVLPAWTITATLSSIKLLTLSWPVTPLAETALVLEDPDGAGPLPETEIAQVASAGGQTSVEIFLPTAIQATYRVALCAGGQCVYSEPLSLSGTLEAAMGYIKSQAAVESAHFGESVALSRDGRVLAVGAHLESVDATEGLGAPSTGAVHLYEKTSPGRWVFRARLLAPFPDDFDRFGSALALSADGSVLAVGSPEMDAMGTADAGANNAGNNTGGVHIFKRLGNTWPAAAFVQGSGASDGDRFGSSVDLSDDGQTLAVGATQLGKMHDDPTRDGKTFVFVDQSNTWTEQAVLRDDNLVSGNAFGNAVALTADGNTLAVGDPRDDSAGTGVFASPLSDTSAVNAGAVHLFQRSGASWARTAYVKAPRDVGSARFGESLDIDASAQTLLVGAPTADLDPSGTLDDTTYSNSGAAFVYVLGTGGWSYSAMLRAPTPVANDRFGQVAALSGNGRVAATGSYLQDNAGVGVGGANAGAFFSEFGAAYAFEARGAAWGPAVVLKPSHVLSEVRALWHGRAVAVSGDGRTMAVGTSSHDGKVSGIQSDPTLPPSQNSFNSGAVYLY